jgi:carbon monoxide dehydrogenase subunit G
MKMSGEQTIPAPRDKVWAALNDAGILRRSIDGCETLERTSDTSFEARVIARIGPVKAGFNGRVNLSDIDPPNGYTISGEGSGAGAGFAKGGAVVRLSGEGNTTRLAYEVNADVGGKLAQIGSRLIEGSARKMADSFFSRFAIIVAEDSKAASIGQTAPATAAIPPTLAVPRATPNGGVFWAFWLAIIVSFTLGRVSVTFDQRWMISGGLMLVAVAAGYLFGRNSRSG